MRRQKGWRAVCLTLRLGAIACGAAVVTAGQVQAVEIASGNDDIQIRWDNTVRYNLAQRVDGQDDTITGSLNNNDGDRNFDKNSIVSNRLDLLSEFDFIYNRDHGFRISAAAWGDDAYNHIDNDSATGSNHLDAGQPAAGLSRTTQRYNRGVSGEWLDVFAFTRLDIGDAPLYLKLGQHTMYWGESLFLGGVTNGIAYAQSPLDIAKGLSIPGAEAKELFRPLNNLSVNLQAIDTLSVSAQYFFDWKPSRYPESGSYLGFSDVIMEGGESLYSPLGQLSRLDDIEPDNQGDIGLSARWSPQWLDGTLGVYYRHFTDRNPQVVVDARGAQAIGGTAGDPVGYRLSYGDDVDLFGVSLAKNIGGVSVGAELSYRQNMPLVSDAVLVASPFTVENVPGFENARTSLPNGGDTGAARGDTLHAVFNMLGQVANTPLFDSLDWKAELTWSSWRKVTSNEELFKGRSGYTGLDRVTKDAWGLTLVAEPKWYQVFPSVDLILPITYSTGLSGTSAVATGGSEDAGSYSVGIAADVRNQYRFDLKYVDFFGKLDATNPSDVVANDPLAYLRDRGMLVFNFKTTF
ncbi:DUF1302 domain-containing protein [Zobellella sp. An-6]|uniref:DUF1302 domain-containing protein n=1 Tax=Zobellella sp. An-6 TaxID=3400218 RepID=UPI004042205B